MDARSISLDQSALSPKEYLSYKHFINQFDLFTRQRHGHLRFAEAAHFLRKSFPFATEREDEIRSFFPQQMQLGQMNQGCVLAILRLLSHINNRPASSQASFHLYRDLIFTQTEPLPSLQHPTASISLSPSVSADLQKPLSQSSNPFRPPDLPSKPTPQLPLHLPPLLPPKVSQLDKRAISINTQLPPPQPRIQQSLSAGDVHGSPFKPASSQLGPPTTSSSNPFRQRSTSSNASSTSLHPSSPASPSLLASPRVPPRPPLSVCSARKPGSASDDERHPPYDIRVQALPPPKHYSQRLRRQSIEEPHLDSCLPPLSRPPAADPPRASSPPRSALPLKPKPAPGLKPKIVTSSYGHENPASRPSESHHTGASRGALCQASLLANAKAAAPPLPTTKPLVPKATLTRAQTLGHHHERTAPPVPPPRRRPESLQLHNPHAVRLDELVVGLSPVPSSGGFGPPEWREGPKGRTVSNSAAFGVASDRTRLHRRRSTSLFEEHEAQAGGDGLGGGERYVRQLKAIEVGLRQEGKEVVKEVKHGWRSRHGKREERVPLVDQRGPTEWIMGTRMRARPQSLGVCRTNGNSDNDDNDDDKDIGWGEAGQEVGWNRLD